MTRLLTTNIATGLLYTDQYADLAQKFEGYDHVRTTLTGTLPAKRMLIIRLLEIYGSAYS